MTENFHGLVLVRKPSGMTSHDVVARLRRILQTKAVGHTGTLDPMAEGMMVLLVNEATKLSQYILEGNKAYTLKARLGVETDTLDITGETLATHPVTVTPEEVKKAGLSLHGDLNLQVPIYSAIKIKGQKLYDYARSEQSVEIPSRVMRFWDVEYLGQEGDEVSFQFKCSKGSYVRSWIALLGRTLGCGATMSALTRTWSEPYFLQDAVTLEELEAGTASEKALIPLERALPGVKKVRIKGQDQNLLMNGQISHGLRSFLITLFDPEKDELVQVQSLTTGRLLALIGLEANKGFVIRRVIKY